MDRWTGNNKGQNKVKAFESKCPESPQGLNRAHPWDSRPHADETGKRLLTKQMRTQQITVFANQLDERMNEFKAQFGVYPRVWRISAPQSRGDVEVIGQVPEGSFCAITFRADGTWSGWSFWSEDQI